MVLEAVDLECIRGERLLFTGLSFGVAPGRALLLEGPNGSGKTSLLRIIAGLTLPETGEIHWNRRPTTEDRAAYRTALAYVGHQPAVKDELSPRENLRFVSRLRTHSPLGPEQALERVGLSRQQDLACRRLSAGQRRRVALARLLLSSAELWLLDEPYTALDRAGIALVEQLLRDHLAAGGLAVLSSHQPPSEGLPLDRLQLGGG